MDIRPYADWVLILDGEKGLYYTENRMPNI